ncbi:MAG TPA: hypothetical protein VF545_05070 [Thermoleophilaceae bacterium]|jgi:hypothetical protein
MARWRLPAPAWGATAAALIAGGVWAVYGRVPLSYDSYFALLWGRDLAHGHAPQYDLRFASTPHPLFTAIGTVLAPLGHGAEAGLRAVVLLALGAACVALFRIAAELAGPAAGVLAAAILLTRAPVLEFANRASVDVPAMALLLWAAALELRRPRRGAAVMALLALVGLLRPEAWLLSAAYWLWLARSLDTGARLRLGALAVAAPALWIGSDLLVTGDALWSSHQTAVKVRDSGDVTGFDALARVPRHVGSILRAPELIAAGAGVGAAIALRMRRAALLGALLGLSAAGALALALDHQTILLRFFFFPAALLAAFAAVAAFGWRTLPADHPHRARWLAAGCLAAAVLAIGAPFDADRISDGRAGLRADERLQSDLRAVSVRDPAKRALHSCHPVYVRAGGTIPLIALFSDTRPAAFAAGPSPSPRGALVTTTSGASADDLPYPLPAPVAAPPGYRQVARGASWVVLRACRGY